TFFFFQAEDGIRDRNVTGVQTCALPILQTVNIFEDVGMDCIGIYQDNRDKEDFLIKDVNGIKIAIIGYSYGYNGMEATLTDSEYKKHLSDLSEDKIEAEIHEAEKIDDVTIVVPQMGTEYASEQSEE